MRDAKGCTVWPDGVTLDNWQVGPANRWAFQHLDEVVPTVAVSRGSGPVLELTAGGPLSVPDLAGFLEQTFTDGLLVLRGREILHEQYFNGMTPDTRHLLMSISKSLCSSIVGQYVTNGVIDVDALVSHYLPELTDSAYGDASVQQVLDMTVAVEYDETYDDPTSQVQTHDRVAGWRTSRPGDPPDSYAFLAGLRKAGHHGRTFAYCSANTDVLAWLLERAGGRPYAELLATDLWSRIGAEHDAFVTVDRSGFASANGGVCVTLRDLARFGRVVLDGGARPDGSTVIPPAWVADTRSGGDPGAAVESMRDAHPNGSYRNQFWITGDSHGAFYGVGIHGQYVWMDPAADVVIAKLSSLPDADDTDNWVTHVSYFDALCRTLA
jgi:CubicO group peptidase (beta-lactamase class C family)